MESVDPGRASPQLRATAEALGQLTEALQGWNAAHIGRPTAPSSQRDEMLAEHRALHVEFQTLHGRDMAGDVSPTAHAGFRSRIAHLIERLRETEREGP